MDKPYCASVGLSLESIKNYHSAVALWRTTKRYRN